jgi:plastocyanin
MKAVALALSFLAVSAYSATVQVSVGDRFFAPPVVNIKANDTVQWNWIGFQPHSSTSRSGLWNSGTQGNGDHFSHQFPDVGKFPYFCTTPGHDNQTGTVAVAAAPVPVDPADLAGGVDRPNLSWTTGGNAVWINQNRITHDHVDAAQSGRPGARGKSWIETTVTGPGTLRFWWRVSSEPNDPLRLLVDGRERARISGESAWLRPSIRIGQGTHTIRWVYQKNATVTAGRDRGWLDQVQFVQ